MRRWLFWVLWEWALIAFALWLAWVNPWLIPLAVLVVGRGQNALSVLGHEAVHRTVGDVDRLADALCFWPLGASVQGVRKFHIKHHVYLNTHLDPEIPQRALFADRWTGLTRWKKARLILADMLLLNAKEPWALMKKVQGRFTAWRRVYLIAAAFAGVLLWVPALVWMLALFTVNFASIRARMWREHLGDEPTDRYVAAWWERWLYLPHYIWKHADHHTAGKWHVPCWKL